MTKSKNRFLYLALLCFLGILTVLVADGYMGVYDTLKVRSGEFEQTFEADFWTQEFAVAQSSAREGDVISCSYMVDNHLFNTYGAKLEVWVERNRERVRDVLSQDLSVAAFKREEITFDIDTTGLTPAQANESLEYSVVIKRGDTERRLVIFVGGGPAKPVGAIG
jgi:hypothetical protein